MESTECTLLVRRPASEVFKALTDPEITTKFWFTKSSGPLVAGEKVRWEWEMYGASAEVAVMELKPGEKITFQWGEPHRRVDIFLKPTNEGTYVMVREWGYVETGPELIAAIKDSTGGFTTMLDAMKAWLEHGIRLNLVADKFRDVKF